MKEAAPGREHAELPVVVRPPEVPRQLEDVPHRRLAAPHVGERRLGHGGRRQRGRLDGGPPRGRALAGGGRRGSAAALPGI